MHLELKEYTDNLPEKVELPKLDYTYEQVEHLMCQEMLDLHYTKLHQGYINRYNSGVKEMEGSSMGVPKTQKEKCLLFNLGGYLNHCIFWKSFSPEKDNYKMSEDLQSLINSSFGSMQDLFSLFEKHVPLIMGSGWIWLLYSKEEKKLLVQITMDQDFPRNGVPLLNIDFWEHAYYLQYKVDKLKYLSAFCESLNWKFASERLAQALSS